MTGYKKKLIEVALPLEAINKESLLRKQKAPKGYPTSVHKWWSQKPLAACRAVLFSQLVDDPSAWPDRFPTEDAQKAERQRLFGVIEKLVLWESTNDEVVINAARAEIARSLAWGREEEPPDNPKGVNEYILKHAPPVYDPFCGGGSIPLEAQRLGLRAYGSDLNPVAVLISKALVEIPPKFAGRPPVNPEAQAELAQGGAWNGTGAQGLAEDVRHYGQWMRDRAFERIGHLYPQVEVTGGMAEGRDDLKPLVGQKLTVVAWLWVRTVVSPNPAARGERVPLVSSFMLSTRKGKRAWVEPVVDNTNNSYTFEIRVGEGKEREGTVKRTGAACLMSGEPIPFEHVRTEGRAGRMGARLMAIVVEGSRGRT